MNLSDLNDKLNQLGNSWEHFKKVNDERLRQIERKGSSDPLTEEHLAKVNNAIDEQKSKLEQIEVALSRPETEVKGFKFTNNGEMEYKKAFDSYIRRGVDSNLANLESKSVLNTSTSGDSYGGYIATPNMQRIITGELQNSCIMRKICSVQEISTSSLDIIDDDSFSTSWNAEAGSVSDTNASTLTKKSIPTHDLIAQPRVTQKLIDDASINIEEWLAYRLGQQFSLAEENAFINGAGSGSNQPVGILNYSAGSTSTTIQRIESADTTDGDFDEDDILNLYYALNEKYVNRASFLMSRSAVQAVRKLKDATSGNYLWQPALLSGSEDMLLGCPVYQSSYMPAVGDDSLSIILGDFSQYQIVDRTGVRILRDPYTSKPYVRFYTTKRVGGDVIKTEAFKVLECGSDGA
jgi:HK97 family phage major capsid protein